MTRSICKKNVHFVVLDSSTKKYHLEKILQQYKNAHIALLDDDIRVTNNFTQTMSGITDMQIQSKAVRVENPLQPLTEQLRAIGEWFTSIPSPIHTTNVQSVEQETSADTMPLLKAPTFFSATGSQSSTNAPVKQECSCSGCAIV